MELEEREGNGRRRTARKGCSLAKVVMFLVSCARVSGLRTRLVKDWRRVRRLLRREAMVCGL